MEAKLSDISHNRAITRVNDLLVRYPGLKRTLETLYVKAWPETMMIIHVLESLSAEAKASPPTAPPQPSKSHTMGEQA